MSEHPRESRTHADDPLADAVRHWRGDLFDLGGRNTLLFYKDLRAGTLDLAEAEPAALDRLLGGAPVRLSRLFPGPDDHAAALRRAKTIRKKVIEFEEERGIPTGFLASGMATWDDDTRTPAAPVLLRPVRLTPAARTTDLELALEEDVDVNPALLHLLRTRFNVAVSDDDFTDLLDSDRGADLSAVFDRLASLSGQVPGFAVRERRVIGNFSYAKLPMVADLENARDLLASSDVVSALAGDPRALDTVRGAAVDRVPSVDSQPPADEYLVLDADSSQSYAINSVVAGQHLVVQGPPGTGKSQTIANLVATLLARGQKVLFVAEKRAAIDAVLRLLDGVGLADLVMDVHDGASDRRRIAQELGTTLERAGQVPPPDTARLHRALDADRRRLRQHDAMLHARRDPWGVSVFDMQNALLALRDSPARTRFPGPVLERLSGERLDDVRAALSEYADLGGFASPTRSPWHTADVPTGNDVRWALQCVRRLRSELLPETLRLVEEAADSVGLRRSDSTQNAVELAELCTAVRDTGRLLRSEARTSDLSGLVAATASRRWRRQRGVALGFGERRGLRRQARTLALAKMPTTALHRALVEAEDQRERWNRMRVDGGTPRVPDTLPALSAALGELVHELDALGSTLPGVDLRELGFSELRDLLSRLAADESLAYRRPRLIELRQTLERDGIGPLLTELDGTDAIGESCTAVFDHAWYASLLEHLLGTDPTYGAFEGASLASSVSRFQEADRAHISGNAQRVRRATAEQLYRVLDTHRDQAALIRKQAALKRRHLPMRKLFQNAPHTLLALKPCWAMSPLVVSQVLPAQRLFDVVVFDEASQIPIADAVPSIMRGGRTVVAGDSRQLPPTSFFAPAEDEDVDSPDPGDDLSFATGFDSILEALCPILPTRSLTWHYRSRNERLIAFSNAWIYDRSLTTFPGSREKDAVRHVVVDHTPLPGETKSVGAEVDEVVRLVLEHAEAWPEESLGVITMGMEHANRIEAALDRARESRRDLDGFFDGHHGERFFVKNLERVQGDERDAIILSLGYGRGADGRMRHHFGPLNNKGGERRLNVAVTRAKRRMTLVSSFDSHDLDPNRLNAEGARLLHAYLEFAASGGRNLGSTWDERPELNPFEIDVRDRLTAAGIPLTCQYGVAGYRIDFVAAHLDHPGRMVLAIEADGASYHSSQSARDRDRLRQQQLERLGWTFHRIWSTDWFRDPQREVDRVKSAYDRAVAAADRTFGGGDAPKNMAAPAAAGSASGEKRSRPRRSAPPVSVVPGTPITEYTDWELIQLVRWIESDGLLRTEDELIRAAMAELGFRRRGNRIVTALKKAIAVHRSAARRAAGER